MTDGQMDAAKEETSRDAQPCKGRNSQYPAQWQTEVTLIHKEVLRMEL